MRNFDSDGLKEIGTEARRLRKALGLSQFELSEKTGLGTTTIKDIESGERNVTLVTLNYLIDGLEVSFVDLFSSLDFSQGVQVE